MDMVNGTQSLIGLRLNRHGHVPSASRSSSSGMKRFFSAETAVGKIHQSLAGALAR